MIVKPGIGTTFYGRLPVILNQDIVESCDIVCLHTAADKTDVDTAEAVRKMNPEARVWMGIPANYLSRMDLFQSRKKVLEECDRVASIALDAGVEVLELNGEGSSDGKVVGDWIGPMGDAAEAARLEELGKAVMEQLKSKTQGKLAIGWTSHDGTGFRIPRKLLLGVDLHSPQHYPAYENHVVNQRELDRRIRWSKGQWDHLAARGIVDGAVCPYGARWSPYFQGWGHSVGALVWGLCEAPTARLWACPGSWSDNALPALRAARKLRAKYGHGPDAVERFQKDVGLSADGAVGPLTLGALGL